MKKFIFKAVPFFGIAFLLPAFVSAQISSEIRDENSNVITGDTLYYWMPPATSHRVDLNQYNISSNSITYKVTKIESTITSGASAWFCIYHNGDSADVQSHCYLPSVFTTPHTFVTSPGDFNMLLADFYSGTNYGTSIIRYRFYDINNPNDTVLITMVYNVTPAGMGESFAGSLGEPYPNPATSFVSIPYNFSNNNPGNTVVTDINGRMVYTQILPAQSGVLYIETSSWANGIYLLSLTDENGIVARRKIVVQQ